MKTYLKKINFIIGDIYRKKIIFLIVLLFIGMFFEILGLGSLLPVLSMIANPENLKEIPLLSECTNEALIVSSTTLRYTAHPQEGGMAGQWGTWQSQTALRIDW